MILVMFPGTWIWTSEQLFLSGAESQGKPPTARRAWRRAIHQLERYLQWHRNTTVAMTNLNTERRVLSPKGYLHRNEAVDDSHIRASCRQTQWVAYMTNTQGGLTMPTVPRGTISNLRRCDWGTQQVVTLVSFAFISEHYHQKEETAQKS